MRTIDLGNQKLELRATPLALLYYRQEFDKDLMGDLVSLQELEKMEEGDFSGFDTVKILQFVYAMNKAANLGKAFPKFEEWLGAMEQLDFTDAGWILGVIEEAQDGFLHSSKPAPPAKQKNKQGGPQY